MVGRVFFVETIWVSSFDVRTGNQCPPRCWGGQKISKCRRYVAIFCCTLAESLRQAHKAKLGISSNRERRTFLSGVIIGFANRLREQKRTQQQQGLVWVADAEGKFCGSVTPTSVASTAKVSPRSETRAAENSW